MDGNQLSTNNKVRGGFNCLGTFGLLLVALSIAPGCRMFDRFQPKPAAPIVLQQDSTLADIMMAVENQTQRVRQLKADANVSAEGLPAAMRGDLLMERPDRLRLQAGVLGVPELGFDLGSNSEWFWIWKKASLPNDPPVFYFARHVDYQQSQLARTTQLEPRWLIDALGLIEFSPHDRHEGPVRLPNGHVEIHTYLTTPSGNKVRVLEVDPKRALILRQTYYDQAGQRIAYIDSSKYQYYREFQVSLPHAVEIHVGTPDGGTTKLSVHLSRFTVNTLYGDPERMWQMPMPTGVPTFNLAAEEPTAASRPDVAFARNDGIERDRFKSPY